MGGRSGDKRLSQRRRATPSWHCVRRWLLAASVHTCWGSKRKILAVLRAERQATWRCGLRQRQGTTFESAFDLHFGSGKKFWGASCGARYVRLCDEGFLTGRGNASSLEAGVIDSADPPLVVNLAVVRGYARQNV